MDQEILQSLAEFARSLLRIGMFGDPERVDVTKDGEKAMRVDVALHDARLVIGPNGDHLRAWGEVFERFASKRAGLHIAVTMDANNYRWQNEERLREIARHAAKEAMFTRSSVKLQPMNAYERRIVHAELALRPDVHTESDGEDPNRCVVVKPLV